MTQTVKSLREKGRKDPFFFIKDVLGYKKMVRRPHRDVLDFLQKSDKRTSLILMPRGSYKSSVVTVGHSVWQLLNDPNKRILVASETQRNAIRFVKEMKSHFEESQKFRALYGDWTNKSNTWKEGEFIVKARNQVKKEASVFASSLEKGTIVGLHFDTIILDDVVSKNNINSTEQIEKTIEYYKLLLSILEPDGKIIVIGTRWSSYELYSWLQEEDGPEAGNVDVFIRQAEDEQGNLLMPQVLSRSFLDQQRKTQGEWIYNCQYLNKSTSKELSTFKEKDVVFYEENPPGLIYFISFDPALAQNRHADYNALIVNGVDYLGNWFIQEAIQIKQEITANTDLIFHLVQKYSPLMCFAIEKYQLERVYKKILIDEMDKRKCFFPIKEINNDNRVSKETRIRGLQPFFESRKIHLKKDQRALHLQILNHPHLKNDDLIDALKTQIQVVFPSDYIPEQKKEEENLTRNEKKVWSELKEFDKKRKVHRTYREDYI